MEDRPVQQPDRHAGVQMWEAYAAAYPQVVATSPDYTIEHFGDSERLADELLDYVIHGGKRATSGLAAEYAGEGEQLPRIGSHGVACDGRGVPRIIMRTTELRLGPFPSADAAFAADEGEGDLSLEYWQEGHRRFFSRVSAAQGREWSEEEDIVFERFTVVWPAEYADTPI